MICCCGRVCPLLLQVHNIHNMSTPVKSPAQKRIKADDVAVVSDGEEVEEVIPDNPPSWVAKMNEEMKKGILSGVREMLQDELQPVKKEVEQLRTQVGNVEKTASKAMEIALQATELAGTSTYLNCLRQSRHRAEKTVFADLLC